MMDCHEYFKQTSRRITLEYTLMEGVNDSLEQVKLPLHGWLILELAGLMLSLQSMLPEAGCARIMSSNF